MIEKGMNNHDGIKNYGAVGFEGVTTTWDLVQNEFSCCGVQNYGDWKNVNQFADGGVPDSCCYYYESCGKGPVDTTKIFTLGCFSLFSDEFKSNFTIIGAIALGIAVGEMIAIVFACCLGRRIGHSGPYVVELDPYSMGVTLWFDPCPRCYFCKYPVVFPLGQIGNCFAISSSNLYKFAFLMFLFWYLFNKLLNYISIVIDVFFLSFYTSFFIHCFL